MRSILVEFLVTAPTEAMQPRYQYSLPQNARQVIEPDLNCSESTRVIPRNVRDWHEAAD
jgi:hypothetical protein